MAPTLAAIACFAFVIHLFRSDFKMEPEASRALWIPLIWMFLAGSRYASAWLNFGQPISLGSDTDGSLVDSIVFFALIVAGIAALARREIAWDQWQAKNLLLLLYFAYCLTSAAWSDLPFVSAKRWVKDLGSPIMALIILTDPDPARSFGIVLRRLSYLLIPLSLLFVKYYPDLGRAYHYDGSPMYTGAGNQKNSLGMMCLITGLYFAWQIIAQRQHFLLWSRAVRMCMYAIVVTLLWLLASSDSQTSIMCLAVATTLFVMSRLSFIAHSPRRIVVVLLLSSVLLVLLESVFDLRAQLLEAMGRDPNLTGRADIWAVLLAMAVDPLIGSGFMNFWSGDRMLAIHAILNAGIKQAHSGYIEQYLNLGAIGAAMMVLLLVNALRLANQQLGSDAPMGLLRLSLVMVAVLYNYTEASFYGINNIWLLTLIALIAKPESRLETSVEDPAMRLAKANAPSPRTRRVEGA